MSTQQGGDWNTEHFEGRALLWTTESEDIVSKLQRPRIIYSQGLKTLLKEQDRSSRPQGTPRFWTLPFPTHTNGWSCLQVQSKVPHIPFGPCVPGGLLLVLFLERSDFPTSIFSLKRHRCLSGPIPDSEFQKKCEEVPWKQEVSTQIFSPPPPPHSPPRVV